jgi:enterobacterial common antigen flippase
VRSRPFLITIAGYGLSVGLGILSGSLAARMLGPTGRGELAAIQNVPNLLLTLVYLGNAHSLTYYVAKRPASAGSLLANALAMSLVACIPVGLIGWIMQREILAEFGAPVRFAGQMFILILPLNVIAAMPWSVFLGLRRVGTFSAVRVQTQLVYCGALGAAFVFGLLDAGWIMLAYLIGTAVICAPTVWGIYAKQVAAPLKFERGLLRETLPFGLMSMLSVLPNALNSRIDQVFIAGMLPGDQLGLYAVAASWAGLALPVVSGIGTTLMPQLAAREGAEAERLFVASMRWAAALIVPFTIMVFAATPVLLPLIFGSAFSPALHTTLLLVLGTGFAAFNIVVEDALRGIGRPKVAMVAELSGLVATVGGLFVALEPFGILGAAVVALVSRVTTTAILITCARTHKAAALRNEGMLGAAVARDQVAVLGRPS